MKNAPFPFPEGLMDEPSPPKRKKVPYVFMCVATVVIALVFLIIFNFDLIRRKLFFRKPMSSEPKAKVVRQDEIRIEPPEKRYAPTSAPKEPEKTKPVPEPVIPSPFLDSGNLGAKELVELELQYGQARKSRPLPQADQDPFFWRTIVFEKTADERGKQMDVRPLPGPHEKEYQSYYSSHYLFWDGLDVKLVKNVHDTEGDSFPVGTGKPAKASVNVDLRNYRSPLRFLKYKRPRSIKYEWLVMKTEGMRLSRTKRVFPPGHGRLELRLKSNTFRQGELDGWTIILCDENANTTFNDGGTKEKGREKFDHARLGCDSIVLQKGPQVESTLFGSLFRADKAYYFISKADEAGRYLMVRRYSGPMGKIQVKFHGCPANFRHLVVGTETGKGRIGFVNLGSEPWRSYSRRRLAEKPVDVPVGTYFLKWGLIEDWLGWTSDAHLEVNRGNTPAFSVKEGETTVLELGAPCEVRLPVEVRGNRAELQTHKLEIVGRSGEAYRGSRHGPFLAEYKVKDAAGTVVASGKTEPFGDYDILPSTDLGIRILEFAKPVEFQFDPAEHREPFTVELKGIHPLLGKFKTPGWD